MSSIFILQNLIAFSLRMKTKYKEIFSYREWHLGYTVAASETSTLKDVTSLAIYLVDTP